MEKLKKEIQRAVDSYKSGNLSESEELARKLIVSNPKVVFLYNLMGLILIGQNKINEAVEYYEKGVKIDPSFAEIYNNLGLLYINNKSDSKKAEYFYKKAISLNPKLAESYNNLGTLYKSLDKFDLAIEFFNKSIQINSKFAHAYHNLGNIYTTIGNFIEAKKNFNRAIEIDPFYTNSYRTLGRLVKHKKDDLLFHKLNDIYNKININDNENKTNIAFALGKANEDIKDYDKSFSFYKEANFLYRKKINFSINNEKEKFQEIKDFFNNEIYKKYPNSGAQNESQIFILGMPRSGTTLIEQILSNHPKVFGGDEQDFIPKILSKNFSNHNLRLFFGNVLESDENFKKIGQEYISMMQNISNNYEKSTDKLPENFLWIGLIKLILPKSKIIHVYRNPEDNCFSLYKNHFPGGKINYSYDLNEIVEYYNLYKDLMSYWNNLFPGFIFNIKYENLISNIQIEIQSLLKYCNLEWNDKCLNFHNNNRPIHTASDVQARNKIYESSINLWKNYEKHLKEYFIKLN